VGGNESLGPPVGGIILAQPVSTTILKITSIKRKKERIIFIQ
jgi:hypothetical protein